MTDRELLELAAKSIGYTLEWQITSFTIEDGVEDAVEIPYAKSNSPDESPWYWNPLEDDGDALRLAVKLRIDLLFDGHDSPNAHIEAAANIPDVEFQPWAAEPLKLDENAATRRAITRAAAAIQLAKQGGAA